jgi:hypothetical protein
MEKFAHMMAAMKNVLSPNSETMMTERAAKNPCRNRSSDIEEPGHKNYSHCFSVEKMQCSTFCVKPKKRVVLYCACAY